MEKITKRDLILSRIKGLALDFLHYDRADDEELSDDDIENAINSGEVTIDEMGNAFRDAIKKYCLFNNIEDMMK